MDRYWLLTWTTYGTWLPGDERGFVADLRDPNGVKYRPNQPRTPYPADNPGLRRFAAERMTGPPIYLTRPQAVRIVPQLVETAGYRGWLLLAAAVMRNHAHLVVGVPGDPDPEKLLQAFKAYISRVLNEEWGRRPNGTWWTAGGSKRKLPDEIAIRDAVEYVLGQRYALVTWETPTRLQLPADVSPPVAGE